MSQLAILRARAGDNYTESCRQGSFSVKRTVLPFLLALGMLLAACGGADETTTVIGDLTIEGAWSRPAVMAGGNGAAYFVIKNGGAAADRLVRAASPLGTTEIHQSMMSADGTMSMQPVDGVDVPAGGSVSFEPGGLHVMFIGVAAPPAVGETIPLTLTFEKAGDVTLEVPVREE